MSEAAVDAASAALDVPVAPVIADIDGLRAAIGGAGFEILHESRASGSDRAYYEQTLAACAERHGGSDSLAYTRRIRDRRAMPGGTDTLGFGLFVLRRC